jgi:hypothetical protein
MQVDPILTDRLESFVQRSMWALHERQQVSSDGVILPQNESRSPCAGYLGHPFFENDGFYTLMSQALCLCKAEKRMIHRI